MARKPNLPNGLIVVAILAVAGIGGYLWLHRHSPLSHGLVAPTASLEPAEPARTVAADRIDAANEGHVVTISGKLDVQSPPRDTQLGIAADGLMLLRFVDMLQWREQCAGADCTYQQVWAPQLIDSSRFREARDHINPRRMPMKSTRFPAADVRIGAFAVDAGALANYLLGAAARQKPLAYAVKAAQLPSNLAITFHDADGALYTGDAAHRAVGDMRVTYRIVPAEKVEITGVQRGNRVITQKSIASPSP